MNEANDRGDDFWCIGRLILDKTLARTKASVTGN
jgi:hypothetical protein